MNRLKGKSCFITAAGQGIGRAIAEAFLSEGARVAATDIDAAKLAGLPSTGNLTHFALDVTDAQAVQRAADRVPDIDVLVNCAGFVAHGTALDCTLDEFRRSFTLNVESMFLTCRAFLPGMIARGGGSIINMASVASTVMAPPNRFAYGASKAAVLGLTLSIARDFAAQNIRCNAISPGTVDTPSLRERMAAGGDIESARRAFLARHPVGRIGAPDEVAALAILLASNEATFMTGSNLVIDGGMSL